MLLTAACTCHSGEAPDGRRQFACRYSSRHRLRHRQLCGRAAGAAGPAGVLVVGVEPSYGMLAYAQAQGIRGCQGQAEAIPMATAAAGLLFSVDVIHHVRAVPAYFAEARARAAPRRADLHRNRFGGDHRHAPVRWPRIGRRQYQASWSGITRSPGSGGGSRVQAFKACATRRSSLPTCCMMRSPTAAAPIRRCSASTTRPGGAGWHVWRRTSNVPLSPVSRVHPRLG